VSVVAPVSGIKRFAGIHIMRCILSDMPITEHEFEGDAIVLSFVHALFFLLASHYYADIDGNHRKTCNLLLTIMFDSIILAPIAYLVIDI
jgi:hypothetical protein